MAQSQKYEGCFIGDDEKKVQGNCVTCFGTLLYLREKGLGVEVRQYLDESLEIPWVNEACPGDVKAPMLRALDDERWLCGTQAIFDYVEQHSPQARLLGRPQQDLGGGFGLGQLAPGMYNDRLFWLLRAALANPDKAAAEGALRDLEALLQRLDAWLAEHGAPFIGGREFSATDCYLAPKLTHAVLSLRELSSWELPGRLASLRGYLEAWHRRPSWQEARFDERLAVGFWQRKAQKAQRAAVL